MLTAFCVKDAVVPKLNEGVVVQSRFHIHVTTASAVSSAWPAPRDKLLPSKGHAAAAPVTCFQFDSRLIEKHILVAQPTFGIPPKANPLPSGISIQ
jgi:hypothetical protein